MTPLFEDKLLRHRRFKGRRAAIRLCINHLGCSWLVASHYVDAIWE